MESNRIDEIASRLDDIATTLDEIEEDCGMKAEALARIRQSIERAIDAIDRLANRDLDSTGHHGADRRNTGAQASSRPSGGS